jgi:hypothetical protein
MTARKLDAATLRYVSGLYYRMAASAGKESRYWANLAKEPHMHSQVQAKWSKEHSDEAARRRCVARHMAQLARLSRARKERK